MTLLLVIDMQRAFINENTEYLIDKVNNLISNKEFDRILFTKFVNKENSIYTKRCNYYGCIGEDKELVIDTKEHDILTKEVYSALNDEFKKYVEENNIDKIYICRIDTECCILKTSLDLFENGYDFYVLKDYCACMEGVERHNNVISILERTTGKDYII